MRGQQIDLNSLPLRGKEFRFGPCRDGVAASTLWKIGVVGSEVYLFVRVPGLEAKVSVHQSGQVHLRLGPKEKFDAAPCIRLGAGPWVHAAQIRFLLSDRAMVPLGQVAGLGKNSAYLLEVPVGSSLYLDLLIGDAEIQADCPLPFELPARRMLWTEPLRDRRRAALVAHIGPFNEEDLADLARIHHELRPTLTVRQGSSESVRPEVVQLLQDRGHNFLLVAPLESRSVRLEVEPQPDAAARPPLSCTFAAPSAESALLAPDGSPVVAISASPASVAFDLVKGVWQTVVLSELTFSLLTENLRMGSPFIASPCLLDCLPSVNGASPREWSYRITGRFNGSEMVLAVREMSTALQNRNLRVPLPGMIDDDELIMRIPETSLRVRLTQNLASARIDLVGRFAFRARS